MFRREATMVIYDENFPRVSGDVPYAAIAAEILRQFSPRERGCSAGTLY